jgi:HAD superfamily phosphoserine phosphatase-like hydrolase
MKSYHKPKAIIWDVDETLIAGTSWIYLIDGLKADRQIHMRLYKDYLSAMITYDQVRPRIMENLSRQANEKMNRAAIREICQDVAILPQALSLMPKLHQAGLRMCLISAGIDLFVEDIAARLGIDHWYANSELVFDAEDMFIDFHFSAEMEALKIKQLDAFLAAVNLGYEDCIAIGDGETDKALFEQVRGIAINSQDEQLKRMAWKNISQLSEIEKIFGLT